MRIGLFGGSFDPFHRGHVEPVREARRVLGLERVIYLPTGRPPHKEGSRFAPPHARYTMVELALLGEEGLFASPFELDDDKPHYTIDTVTHFARQMPEAELVYLIGADSWESFTTWRAWQWILEAVELAVLVRPGFEAGELAGPFAAARKAGRLHFVANAPVALSSTEIRRRLAAGRELPADTAPPLVLDYIRKYRLYSSP